MQRTMKNMRILMQKGSRKKIQVQKGKYIVIVDIVHIGIFKVNLTKVHAYTKIKWRLERHSLRKDLIHTQKIREISWYAHKVHIGCNNRPHLMQ